MRKQKVLYSWIGETDIKKSKEKPGENLHGRILQAWGFEEFDELRVLSDFEISVNIAFKNSLPKEMQEKTTVIKVDLPKDKKKDYQRIFEITLLEIENRLNEEEMLYFHASSGTKPMHTIWILIAQNLGNITVIESDSKGPVKEVVLPKINLEFIKANARKKAFLDILEPTPLQKGFEGIIHKSEKMAITIDRAQKLANTGFRIFLHGETGTGKELFARSIHDVRVKAGSIKDKFVPVNCGSLTENLLTAEFFGYNKGAFTGADKDKLGYFRESSGGTLFLDEIADLPMQGQIMLLRAIQEKEVVPVNESNPIKVDLSIITASHKDLLHEVSKGNFREDLYYRLNEAKLKILPLRERSEDIEILMSYLLKVILEEAGRDFKKDKIFCPNAIKFVKSLPLKGNIRELNSLIIGAFINSTDNKITTKNFEDELPPNISSENELLPELSQGFDIKKVKKGIEKYYMEQALVKAGGNYSKAEKLLGLKRNNLRTKISKINSNE